MEDYGQKVKSFGMCQVYRFASTRRHRLDASTIDYSIRVHGKRIKRSILPPLLYITQENRQKKALPDTLYIHHGKEQTFYEKEHMFYRKERLFYEKEHMFGFPALHNTTLCVIITNNMAKRDLVPLTDMDDSIKDIMGNSDNPVLYRLLSTMTMTQLRYIAQRLILPYDKDAAIAIGITPGTPANWDNKGDIDEALGLLQTNQIFLAQYMLQKHAASILNEMISMFYDTEDPSLRLKIGRDLLNRLGMVPPARSESVSFTKQIIEHRHPSELTDAQLHSIANTVVEGDFSDIDDT